MEENRLSYPAPSINYRVWWEVIMRISAANSAFSCECMGVGSIILCVVCLFMIPVVSTAQPIALIGLISRGNDGVTMVS